MQRRHVSRHQFYLTMFLNAMSKERWDIDKARIQRTRFMRFLGFKTRSWSLLQNPVDPNEPFLVSPPGLLLFPLFSRVVLMPHLSLVWRRPVVSFDSVTHSSFVLFERLPFLGVTFLSQREGIVTLLIVICLYLFLIFFFLLVKVILVCTWRCVSFDVFGVVFGVVFRLSSSNTPFNVRGSFASHRFLLRFLKNH